MGNQFKRCVQKGCEIFGLIVKEVPCKSPCNVGPSIERKLERCGEDQGTTYETKASIGQIEAQEIDPVIRKYQDVFR